jgi:hypothetical protein
VSGSGYQEQSLLTFAVTTQDGRPYPPGLPVTFSHLSQGDSFVGPSPRCDTGGATKTCEAIATTDRAGRVAVLLSSGRKFALLFVRAEASAAGVTGSFTAGAFPVVAAKASGMNLTVECGSYLEIALTSAAPTPVGPPVTCTAQAMDRNGIAIGIPVEVSFHAEAGTLGPLAWTPPYDPEKPIAEQHQLGHAVTFLDLLATPPGDGVATVVAMLPGEEGFVDLNQNGRYDEGEPFFDQGEPFVDANDNGIRDPDEWYLDVNGNGIYDGPNGKWDADTVIWAQTHVAFPGAAVTALCNCADATCRPQGDRLGGVCDDQGHTCSPLDTNGRSICNSAPLAVGSIELVAFEHDVLGAVGSGYHERSVVTFQVRTREGQPYPPGLLVTFTHESQGGSFVGPLPNCTVTAGGPTCTAQGVTDTEGKVRVLLSSGRTFAVLSVRADAAAGGENRSYTAGGFPVVGAKPNGAHLSLDCRPYNIPALTAHDCLYSHYAGRAQTVDCTLKMADRHGIVLGVPTEATFRSEAGAVSYPATSPAYDPATAISDQRDLGHAVGYLEVYGSPLPVDVAPFPGEPSVLVTGGLCGSRTANPRDGLVTVIAMVRGEEGFVDLNQNGKYDDGEPFIDQGEPYVDANDNGIRDPDEWYLDVNGNGQYDGPNGVWDEDTVLWTQTRVLYTGYPVLPTPGPTQNHSRLYTSGSPPAPTPTPADFSVVARPASHQDYGVFFTDENLNPLTSFATYDARPTFGMVNALLLGPDHTQDELGISFRLLYCDETIDPSTGVLPPTAVCFSGPADNACRADPCFVVPDVGLCRPATPTQPPTCDGFVSGNRGTLRISGLGDETKLGDDAVMVTTEIEGVKAVMWIQGRSVLAGP